MSNTTIHAGAPIGTPAFAQSHPAKRRAILEAAARVFCDEGFGGANIDLVAAAAGVSRQTVYNHFDDKAGLFAAVVREVTLHCNASFFDTLASFPDRPADLQADLTAFAVELNARCVDNREGRYLRKLLQAEGERYPELFAGWREMGPHAVEAALAARLARLAHAGLLDIDDPDLAARQFFALINADAHVSSMLGHTPTDEERARSAETAVRTFLRAYGVRGGAHAVRPTARTPLPQ